MCGAKMPRCIAAPWHCFVSEFLCLLANRIVFVFYEQALWANAEEAFGGYGGINENRTTAGA